QPLTPGVPVELDIEIWPTSIVIPVGYRLALSVRGKDYEYDGTDAAPPHAPYAMRGVGPFTHTHPQDRPPEIFGGTNTLHFADGRMPYVLLPVIPSEQGGPFERPAGHLRRDGVAQERVGQRLVVGDVRVVGGAGMAALGRLVEIDAGAEREKLRGHLAGMARMHAVVARRGGEQDRRVVAPRRDELIGGDLLEKRPVLRLV